MNQQLDLVVKSVLDSWHTNVSRTDKLLNELTDEQLQNEASAGRNTGTYLLGHLTAVHSRMLPLLGLGEQLHPHLDEPFLLNPDKSGKEIPTIPQLRAHWTEVNNALATQFAKMQPEEWLQRHTSVSEEDFAKEPHRNRLNVLLSRTTHLAGHAGQLLYLKNR